ncbi:MAG: ATP-binding protein [Candidatus Margulisbacteria bacterium]|nr:ATP-binding protein [Candidatus Margulisiibacteriota bacterium]
MFEAVLFGLRDGVLVLNNSGEIIYANQAMADLFSVKLAELTGKRLIEAIRLVELTDLVEEAKTYRRPHEKEIKVFYPAEKTLLASVNIVKQEAGEDIFAIVFRDISEMKRLENLRSEFVANVSHEMKTPLTAIRNYAETLLNGALGDKDHNTEFVAKIEKHAENLSILIDDLLEISQLESKRGLGEFVPINVWRVVDRAVETLAGKARKRKIDLAVNCDNKDLTVSGVEDHLYRAVLNLLDNALNYTDPGGNVTVACDRLDGEIRIAIADTGIGIAKEHLPRLFERFYRIDKARSRDQGGTGLGLAIVKHVMNIHGGLVSVESEEGKGSKFTLTFPA